MNNTNLNIACHGLAMQLMFEKNLVCELEMTLSIHGVQFRKGKTIDDIRNAIAKGLKAGNAKTEFEISMTACYLAKVVKLA